MKKVFLFLLLGISLSLSAHSDDDAILGISSSEISRSKAQKLGLEYPYGSRINRINPGSAAEQLGLQPLDYIYRIDDRTVSKDEGRTDILGNYRPGEKVKVYYFRDGKNLNGQVALSRRGDVPHRRIPDEEDPFLGVESRHGDGKQEIEGARVSIVNNSTAQAMGLEDGDIITAIDGYPIFDFHDLTPTIDNRQVGAPIEATFYRDGQVFTRSRPIKSEKATRSGHSRPDGPQVIAAAPEDEGTVSTAELVPASQKEATIIEEVNETEMPLANNLQIERVNIFPNPNSGIFDIQFELPERGETIVRIFNSAGQPVYFNTLGNFSGTFSDRIDIANGVKGIFFLEINQEGRSITRKVVLQ